MKRILICLMVLVCLLSACSAGSPKLAAPITHGAHSEQGESGPGINPFVTLDMRQAAAYLQVIESLITLHGEGTIEANRYDNADCLAGLAIVRLLDFDGDGSYELYCAYSQESGEQLADRYYANVQSIYGYGEDGVYTILELAPVSNPGTGVEPCVTFQTIGNRVYLLDRQEIASGDYYTVEDGQLISDFSYRWGWGEGNSYLNGELIADEELWAAVEERDAQGTVERIDLAYTSDTSSLEETQKIISFLRALVPTEPLELILDSEEELAEWPNEKPEEQQGWVYTLEGSFSEDYFLSEESTQPYFEIDVSLPVINMNSPQAQAVNEIMQTHLDNVLNRRQNSLEQLEIEDAGWWGFTCFINYDFAVHGEVLSLYIRVESSGTDIPYIVYETYNFDLGSGKLLTQEELLAAFGIDEEALDDAVYVAVSADATAYYYQDEETLEININTTMETYQAQKEAQALALFIDAGEQPYLYLRVHNRNLNGGDHDAFLPLSI